MIARGERLRQAAGRTRPWQRHLLLLVAFALLALPIVATKAVETQSSLRREVITRSPQRKECALSALPSTVLDPDGGVKTVGPKGLGGGRTVPLGSRP